MDTSGVPLLVGDGGRAARRLPQRCSGPADRQRHGMGGLSKGRGLAAQVAPPGALSCGGKHGGKRHRAW